jgi:hypothetical protein
VEQGREHAAWARRSGANGVGAGERREEEEKPGWCANRWGWVVSGTG